MHAIERAANCPGPGKVVLGIPSFPLPSNTKDQTSIEMVCRKEVSSWAEESLFWFTHWIFPFQHCDPIMSYCAGTTLGVP